jgi:signal transduction histidine kinase
VDVTSFFAQNLIAIFFFYGLAFFCMGLAITLEVGHTSEMYFARALRPLSWFGFIHGSHEWLEMFLILKGGQGQQFDPGLINGLRVILLAASFCMLLTFGVWLVAANLSTRQKVGILALAGVVYTIGLLGLLASNPVSPATLVLADVYTRYSLAIPGAALTTWGLILQQRRFADAGLHGFGKDVIVAAIAFALYGGVGQLFATPTQVFPTNLLNSDIFMTWAGFPIQVFRAVMAGVAAIFIIRSLRAFEVVNKQNIQRLQEAQIAEHRQMESLRAELYQRTMRAQEAERHRISRELHDSTGQTLTALGLGLRGLTDTIQTDPSRAIGQANQLQDLARGALDELGRMVAGLHPPQLDDLGLVSAIRSLGREISQHSELIINVVNDLHGFDIPPEARIVLFRLAQEALTNTVRHAQATQATVRLTASEDHILMEINDNGRGFDEHEVNQDPQHPKLGLLGMVERAALLGGTCQIKSSPDKGTQIRIVIPLPAHEEAYD